MDRRKGLGRSGYGGMKPPPSGAEAFKYGPGPGTRDEVRGDLAERRIAAQRKELSKRSGKEWEPRSVLASG